MRRRVVVTGTGALTPVGNSTSEFWENITKGVSGTGTLTQIDKDQFPSTVAAEVKNFDASEYLDKKTVRRTDRFLHFAVAASKMALDESGLSIDQEDPYRCGVLVGTGIGGLRVTEDNCEAYFSKGPSRISPFMIPMLIVNMASGYVAIQFGLKGPNSCIATACATGTQAIGDAFRLIQYGDAEVMVAGGTESCITPLGFGGFCAMKALSTRNDEPEAASRPFDKTRDGFVMAEGCGVIILEEYEHAKARGANILAEIVGFGQTADANHITAPDPEGKGAIKCMEAAMKDGNGEGGEKLYINAHGTSTAMNDRVETLAIKTLFGEDTARKINISSTKSMTGHALGAAGGIEAIASIKALQEGVIPPTINLNTPDPDCDLDYTANTAKEAKVEFALSNSFGFGGHNASILLKSV